MNGNIILPKKLVEEMFSLQKKWADLSNELEDYLFSRDKKFIQKMKKSRKEHQEGNLRDIRKLK